MWVYLLSCHLKCGRLSLSLSFGEKCSIPLIILVGLWTLSSKYMSFLCWEPGGVSLEWSHGITSIEVPTALAGNWTPASCLAGENSTTEQLMLVIFFWLILHITFIKKNGIKQKLLLDKYTGTTNFFDFSFLHFYWRTLLSQFGVSWATSPCLALCSSLSA